MLEHHLYIAVCPLQDQSDNPVSFAFFPVPKKGTDMTTINPYPKYEHAKMEGLYTMQAQLRRRDHMCKVDMSDVYMHLLITEVDRLFFRFLFDGIKYECTAMPFGLAPAPRIATKFLLPAI